MTAALLPQYAASAWVVVEFVDCPDCEGEGQVEGFEDRWASSTETHYTVETRDECETCRGSGRITVEQLDDDELEELGLRMDDDGTVYAPRERRRP